MECTVHSWMYTSIAPDLPNDVMTPGASARHVWLAIEDHFFGSKETRALILDAEFHNFVQGDLPISHYCRKLQSMVDSLDDLGEPILDRTLVLSVLRVLNKKFACMGAILKSQKSFPSFTEVKTISWLKRSQWPSHRRLHRHSSPPLCALLSIWPRVAQYQCSSPRRKIRTRRTVVWFGLHFTICGPASFRCGPGRRTCLCLARVLPARSSNTEGLLRHSSLVHLVRSRHSSEGLLGLPSVGQEFPVACCRCPLASCLGRLFLAYLGQLASVGLLLACLDPLCGYPHNPRHNRRVSCRPHRVRFGTNTTSPPTSTR
jgi:hypothetical protein